MHPLSPTEATGVPQLSGTAFTDNVIYILDQMQKAYSLSQFFYLLIKSWSQPVKYNDE